MRRMLIVAMLFTLASANARAETPSPRLLALDFEIVDTSNEPGDKRADHARRLRLVRDWIATELDARKIYKNIDIGRVRAKLDAILAGQYLRTCNGCELDLARDVDADFVLLGKFNKISTLIGTLDLLIRDAKTGEVVQARTLGFRGDTDQAWLRAASFYVGEIARDGAPGVKRTP